VRTWQKSLIWTLITLAIGGVYLYTVWRHRQDPGVIGRTTANSRASVNEVAVPRTLSPLHFEDTLVLEDKCVWMRNGDTMAYFPYAGRQVVFSRRIGVIPPLQRLEIKKIVKAAVPASVDDGMSHGSRQAFAVFALPGSATLYATPIGAMQGSDEAYYTDLLFFYDDPHTIYSNWPADLWAAIDAHQVKPGMSEMETRLAIGQDVHSDRRTVGDRTVTYNAAGKQWTVTYVDDHATTIESK
jgi:hypothetical protein